MASQYPLCPVRPEIPPQLRRRIGRAADDLALTPRAYLLQVLERNVPRHFLADAEAPPPGGGGAMPATTDEAEAER